MRSLKSENGRRAGLEALFMVFLGGEAQIQVGGMVSAEKSTQPDEKNAEKLQGGTLYKVAQGDVLFIPANTWHQTIVAPGKR